MLITVVGPYCRLFATSVCRLRTRRRRAQSFWSSSVHHHNGSLQAPVFLGTDSTPLYLRHANPDHLPRGRNPAPIHDTFIRVLFLVFFRLGPSRILPPLFDQAFSTRIRGGVRLKNKTSLSLRHLKEKCCLMNGIFLLISMFLCSNLNYLYLMVRYDIYVCGSYSFANLLYQVDAFSAGQGERARHDIHRNCCSPAAY
jgi:hypothetical protein